MFGVFLLLISYFVIAGTFTKQLGDTTDTFTGTTINASLWNTSNTSNVDLYQNDKIFISGTYGADGEDVASLFINGSYVNFSEVFNVTIEVDLISSNLSVGNQSEVAVGLIKGDQYTDWYFCSVAYRNDSTDGATTKLLFTNPNYDGNDSTIFTEGYLDSNVTFSYDPTTGIFKCQVKTYLGINTTTFKYGGNPSELDNWTNLSLFLDVGLSDGLGNDGSGFINVSIDNFNFNTEADDEEDEEGGGSSVPEWEDYAVLLILVTVIGGFFSIRRRE